MSRWMCLVWICLSTLVSTGWAAENRLSETTTPTATVAPAIQSHATASFAGAWTTDFNRMELHQNGAHVTGTYAHAGGRIDGTVEGSVLTGVWTQTNGKGRFVFRLSADGRRFTGTWGRDENAVSGGAWNGTRIGAPPPPPETPSAASFAGAWTTDFNRMELHQNGAHVTGTYAHAGGRIEGTVEGSVLTGVWTQTNGKGRFVFRLSADGKRFTGTWGRDENAVSGGAWNGTRIGAPPPPPETPTAASFAGAWTTDFNRMELHQNGAHVTGTYAHAGGRIDGTVEGSVLTGVWTQTNGKGRFVFRLSADGKRFTGTWGRDENAVSGGAWNGSRIP